MRHNRDLYKCFTTVDIECYRVCELYAKSKGIIKEIAPLRDRGCTIWAELDARNEHVARLEEENLSYRER